MMRMTDSPTIREPGEPMFKYVANMHGDEAIGRIQYLCNHYGEDDHVNNLINSTDIYTVPSDGFENSIVGSCGDGGGQNNAHDRPE